MVKYALPVICFAAFLQPGMAQNNISGPAALPTIVNAGNVYNPFIEKQSRLYNGIEHLGYAFKIKGHAYFLQRELQTGSVVYDGLEFVNVPMLYDLLKDQVVVQHFNGFTKIGLVHEKVTAFTLNGHHFIRLDSLLGPPIITGYYDEVYTGRLKVLVKRGKYIEETIKDELEREFIQKDLFFIQKEGTYYAIKNYKGLLALLKDRSKEVRQYLRKNRIKYRKGPENAIVKATAYYDSLNK
ncbi:hypothetical protein A3860_00400 [Niastella vici]|uniref:WG repeat-containing protein n=2 Tax=Niastella vici TaxID=1703345 RepID=A0A1V9G8I8_9BACT|nr:hypothetical protein A3860_00400 [Niastella vici]